MIKLEKVNKYYNKRKRNKIHVINNTSIELEDRGLAAFLGISGSGKTTLLNAIGGLDKIDSGDIYIGSERITRRSGGKTDDIRNAYIGYIFQNYCLIEEETVFFNVAVALRMMGVKDKAEIEKRVMYILNKVGIGRYRNRPARALSGGERQRVGIARALVKNPRIIIADEPTGNLDSRNTIEIMNIIKAISKERLVILVTHERELAEFYATRIIEIADGTVVRDTCNKRDNMLDYRMENRIYLKDLPVQQEFSGDNVKIAFYCDSKAKPVKIKVVVKNNNIYLEFPEGYREGSNATELVDGHYQKLSKEVYEDYEFNYNEIAGKQGKIKYTSIFSLGRLIINGFKKILSYSFLRKMLLIGFVFASAFTLYAVSSITAITTISDEKFIRVNKNYLTVETSKITPDFYDRFRNMGDVDFVLPGNSLLSLEMPLNDYYQTYGQRAAINGSAADRSMLAPGDMILGILPQRPDEIALDKMVIGQLLDADNVHGTGILSEEDLLGRTVNGNKAGDLKISGICDTGSPCIYMDQSILFDVLSSDEQNKSQYTGYGNADVYCDKVSALPQTSAAGVEDYKKVVAGGEVTVKKGRLPENDYEVMLPLDMSYSVKIGKTTDPQVHGQKLTVTGFYDDRRIDRESMGIMYVNTNTFRYAFLENLNQMTISTKDKEAVYEKLRDEHVKVTDNYARDREEYIKRVRDRIFSTVVVSLIILSISLAEIYLMLRSSFLSRIKEVGVLRAIGLKKKDVYKMFMGEIIAMTAVTALPSMALMGYILNEIKSLPYVGDEIMMNPAIFLASLLIVFAANTVFGLLPAFSTMRKTPAEILARNDVN